MLNKAAVRIIGGALLVAGMLFFAQHLMKQKTAAVDPPSEAPMNSSANSPHEPSLAYPETRRGDDVDIYHGIDVADPYRWLEDADSDETAAWVEAQNKVTQGYLEEIPERDALRERLTHLWDYERFGMPKIAGGRYFYSHNDGLQNQSELLVAESLQAEPRLLLDPNTLSEDATISLAGWSPSDDGTALAYGLSDGGSDWRTWKFLDVETAQPLDDQLHWIRNGGVSWTPDGKGVYYARYPEPVAGADDTNIDLGQRLFYHAMGTPQSDDRLIYERPDHPDWTYGSGVTEDERYLIIQVYKGTLRKNQVFYRDLSNDEAEVVELIPGYQWAYSFLGNDGPLFYFLTDDGAPLWRLIAIDITQPEQEHWQEIVPEQAETLDGASLFGDLILAEYMKDATSLVRRFNTTGELLGVIDLPALGSVGGFGGKRTQNETFYYYTDYTTPASIYRYDIESDESSLFRSPQIDFDGSPYETQQVFYESRDGTRVPMFITHKKDLELDGERPTLLYGYGGFNVSLTPSFSTKNAVWLEMGGVLAIPNLRGGGEYGRPWHEAGIVENKQNVFDDFIAAAEWLIQHNYTNERHLAIQGGSNGGLLVGACTTQRPELFAAALPAVGVMDMLRYHKFTIGWMWASDYGTSDDAAHFTVLHEYSPLHNIQPGTPYPATLITTADHDDRVVPAHSFKYAATLQAAQSGNAPILIRIDVRAGHGAGTPTNKRIELTADQLAFLADRLGIDADDH